MGKLDEGGYYYGFGEDELKLGEGSLVFAQEKKGFDFTLDTHLISKSMLNVLENKNSVVMPEDSCDMSKEGIISLATSLFGP